MTKLSLASGMKLFHGSLFFHIDELHTISRGIGLLVLELLTVTVTKETKFYHINQSNLLAFNSKDYPSAISSKALTSIGEYIEPSRSDTPTAFLGSCINHISNGQGMRHVDISQYLLQYALSWDVSESNLDEMDDACINITGSLNFKLVGRAWLKNKAEITSTYYAVRNREHCRANYHVFFTTSLYKNNLGVTRRRGSYVGTVIWFCKQKFNGANFFLAFAKLTNNPSTTQHSSLIPQVEKTKPSAQQKYAIILLNHDIKHQVGLVKQLSGNHRYSVIIPEGSFTVEELVDDGGKWSNV